MSFCNSLGDKCIPGIARACSMSVHFGRLNASFAIHRDVVTKHSDFVYSQIYPQIDSWMANRRLSRD